MQHERRAVGSLHISYDDGPPAIRAARNTVSEELSQRGWNAADIDRVRLLVSELTANAVLHARTSFELHCDIDGDARIEVVDWRPDEVPQLRDVEPERPGGLGMRLVERLADDWGVERHDDCKVVWCVVCRSRNGHDLGTSPDPGEADTPTA